MSAHFLLSEIHIGSIQFKASKAQLPRQLPIPQVSNIVSVSYAANGKRVIRIEPVDLSHAKIEFSLFLLTRSQVAGLLDLLKSAASFSLLLKVGGDEPWFNNFTAIFDNNGLNISLHERQAWSEDRYYARVSLLILEGEFTPYAVGSGGD
jgi:hypothetical protein